MMYVYSSFAHLGQAGYKEAPDADGRLATACRCGAAGSDAAAIVAHTFAHLCSVGSIAMFAIPMHVLCVMMMSNASRTADKG